MFYQTRARKKKGLTDPVAIIPFASQNLREKIIDAPKAIAPSISQAIYDKPVPKVLTTPSGNLQSNHLSIKKMLEPSITNSESSGTNSKDLPRNSFHFDDVKMFWRRFANDMKLQGKETFYNAMIKRDPKVKDEVHFTMEVDNQVQVDYINAELEHLITFLRSSLKNFDITLNIQITENAEQETKFLSGKDKFTVLSRKYPNLHSLKTTFNLDIDY